MKILSKLLLFFLVLSFAACNQKNTTNIAATVGSEKITVNELRDAFKRKAQLLGINSITPEMKKDVLDLMIERAVVYQYAKGQGMKVSRNSLRASTKGMAADQKAEKLKTIKKQLLIDQAWSEITKGAQVTPKEIEAYYQKHKDTFRLPDRYKVYLVKVHKARAAHVLQKAKEDPEAFDDMALNTSSKELRQINSNAPFTPKDGFPDEMAHLLEKMKKGDIAGPVTVARGLFIFKLVDKDPAHTQPLSEVSTRIEHTLLQQKMDEKFQEWYKQEKGKYPVKVLVKNL